MQHINTLKYGAICDDSGTVIREMDRSASDEAETESSAVDTHFWWRGVAGDPTFAQSKSRLAYETDCFNKFSLRCHRKMFLKEDCTSVGA